MLYHIRLLKILLGSKIFLTCMGMYGGLNTFFLHGTTIFSIFYLLASAYAVSANQMYGDWMMIFIAIFVPLLSLGWIVFYFIFLISKNKRNAMFFFLVVNLLDVWFIRQSLKSSFSKGKVFGIILSLFISGLLGVSLYKSNKTISE